MSGGERRPGPESGQGSVREPDRELVSVIIPAYRVEAYLDDCVASVAAQTHRELDIILVDDGSPDRCPQLCDAWRARDPRIRVIHQRNGGLSSARNAGLDAARGTAIAFVDGDDLIERNMIATMLGWLRSHPVDVAMCGTMKVFGGGRREHIDAGLPARTFSPDQALDAFLHHRDRMASAVWNKLFDARLFGGTPGVPPLRFPEGMTNEDYLVLSRIYGAMRGLYFDPTPLYRYRIRERSITTSPVGEHSFDRVRIARMCCRHLRRSGYRDERALAYCLMQSWYDVLHDLAARRAGAAAIRRGKRGLRRAAAPVRQYRSVPAGRKARIILMAHAPTLYVTAQAICRRISVMPVRRRKEGSRA